MTTPPPLEVFDLFAVPGPGVPLAGGQGHSVCAGDLVLSPGRDERVAAVLNPVLAPFAAQLDSERPRTLRLAMPIPTRDLRWVVDGWGATRFEPGASPCHDLDVLTATSRLFHARLAAAVPIRPDGLPRRDDRWARAERVAFGDAPAPAVLPEQTRALLGRLSRELRTAGPAGDLGPERLVHGDLANNVLLDQDRVPLVIDVAAYWRPALWAEAVCVLDAVTWLGADPTAMERWADGAARQAILRAAVFRLLSDELNDVEPYHRSLGPLLD
ncbi:MAG TPA: aminoglycoside phosphotransferase [Ornithinicoccus sp.]|nr:aminoglycoside phosphotransferase [Ornithinicoccus sp.]